jgi:cob(I)alamin adenosyltransferase
MIIYSHVKISNMRITKVYTKFGDGGKTYLADGTVVSKSHPLVSSYGEVDELNSFLGLLRAELSPELKELDDLLREIQNDMFKLGADLATPLSAKFQINRISENDVKKLEELIDSYNSHLKPLEEFILPSGCKESALFHICRTICRRAERELVRAMESGIEININVQIYLNRLSDLFFVLARWCNYKKGIKEEGASFK